MQINAEEKVVVIIRQWVLSETKEKSTPSGQSNLRVSECRKIFQEAARLGGRTWQLDLLPRKIFRDSLAVLTHKRTGIKNDDVKLPVLKHRYAPPSPVPFLHSVCALIYPANRKQMQSVKGTMVQIIQKKPWQRSSGAKAFQSLLLESV